MSQSLSYMIQRLKPYWLDAASAAVGIEINKIIHFPASAAPAEFYAKTEAGLLAAIAATSNYSHILIPPCTITLTGVVTIPDYVGIYGRDKTYTIIGDYGFIMGQESYLANLSVIITRSSAGEIIGIEGPDTGSGYVEMCDIQVTNSGAGNAFCATADNGLSSNNGDLYIKDCFLEAYSTGGNGYCGRSSAGRLFVFHSRAAYFTTDRFLTV